MIQSIRKHKEQITLFFIVGVISAAIEISLMRIFSQPQALPSLFSFENKRYAYPLSNILSTAGGILSNYFFSIYLVFKRGKHSKRKEFYLFIILSLITMLLSWLIFVFFHSFIYLPINFGIITISDIVFCKAMAIALVSSINYIVKKKIIFSN